VKFFLAVDFFEIVHDVEDLICRGAKFPDDFAVRGILLSFQRAARFVNEPQVPGDQLPLCVADAKHPTGTRCGVLVEGSRAGFAIAMSLPS
jgi:hypothetical protein